MRGSCRYCLISLPYSSSAFWVWGAATAGAAFPLRDCAAAPPATSRTSPAIDARRTFVFIGSSLREDFANYTALAIFGDINGPFFDNKGLVRRNSQRAIDCRMEVFHRDRILDRRTGTLVRGLAIEEAALHAAAEQQRGS